MGDTTTLHRADDRTRTYLAAARDSGALVDAVAEPRRDRRTDRQGTARRPPPRPGRALPRRPHRRGRRGLPRDRMLFASELADARVQTGDVNGAIEAARQSLALAERSAPAVSTTTWPASPPPCASSTTPPRRPHPPR
ncbi:hypothetical protein NKH18_18940 [Streptomyces sp. M10(2022)]